MKSIKLPILSVALVSLVLAGCTERSADGNGPFLVSSRSVYHMSDGGHADGYYANRRAYVDEYASAEHRGDTLIATTLHEVNACAEEVGQIAIAADTISLETKRVGDVACASVEFHLFTYVIVGKDLERYSLKF